MRRGARQVFTAAAATLMTACGAILALEPLAFDDPTTEGGLGPDADGGVPVGDAVAADGKTLSDGGDASKGTFCSSATHDFCDDFEGTRTIQGKWSAFGAFGTATAVIEAGTFFAQMTTSDAAGPDVPRAGFVLDQPWSLADAGGRRGTRIRFRALLEQCPETGSVEPTSIGLGGKSVQIVFFRQVGDCVAHVREIAEPGPVYRASTTLLVPVGTWENYAVELPANEAGTGGQAKLEVGAQTATLDLTATPEPTRFYVLVGMFQGTYVGANARVRLDDVGIDYLK